MIAWWMLAKLFGARILLTLGGGTALLIMADLAEMSRQLAEHEEPLLVILTVYGNLLPSLALQALPVAVLLGTLLSVTDMVRSRELLALRASGASPLWLAAPALLISATLAGVGLWTADYMAPPGVRKATEIQMNELGRMRSAWSPFHREHDWFAAAGGGLYHVRGLTPSGDRIDGLTRYDHEDGRLTAITLADDLDYEGGVWTARQSRGWLLDPGDGARLALTSEPIVVPEGPAHFTGVRAHPEALGRSDLREAIRLRRAQGQPSLPYELEAQTRRTMPLLGLTLAILALGLGLVVRPPPTHVEAAALAIAVAFVAWTTLAVFRALGVAALLSPGAAALVPVALPAVVGLALLLRRP